MKKVSTKHFLYISSILLICFFVFSCNKENNPVFIPEPPVNPPDTVSRYIWTATRLLTPMFNVYAADTNLLYIAGNGQLLTFDGTNVSLFNLNDPNFRVLDVYGYDKNSIFVTGLTINDKLNLPTVKKITNGNVESFILDNEDSGIYDLLVTGPNQAWFSSHTKSKVYYFNSGTITEHRLSTNDSIKDVKFYKNEFNEIFAFARQLTSNSRGFLYTYKFIGGLFQFIRKDCYAYFDENCLTNLICRCGDDALMYTYFPKLYYFNGNEWIVHSYIETPELTVPFKLGGVSKDSLVAFCLPYSIIYTYNGVKWSRENNSPWFEPALGLHSNIETKFGSVYFTYWDESLGIFGYIIIGRPNRTDTITLSTPSHRTSHNKE